jgi:hypothetical protein
LDVATDAGFTQFLEGYEGRDVSAVTSFTVSGLPAHSTYYYRVRADQRLFRHDGCSAGLLDLPAGDT